MLAGFIMNGTNLTNEFAQSPDFEIGTQKEAIENYLFPYRNAMDYKQIKIPRYLMKL